MVGRAWLGCVLMAASLAQAREYAFGGPWQTPAPPAPPRFAPGSAVGPWAFLELGGFLGAGTFVDPRLYSFAGLATSVSAGWGFEAGRVHLRPSARFSLGYLLTLPDVELGTRLSTSPVTLSLAATNLLDEPHTGLRLTPALGFTVPTSLSRSTPLTTLFFALQLERRFGPVELALRSEVGKPFYGTYATPPQRCALCGVEAQPGVNWQWGNTLQAEWWITPSLSVGSSLAWNIAWGFPIDAQFARLDANGNPVTGPNQTDSITGRLLLTWAFTRLFGLSVEVDTTQPPLFPDNRRVRFPFLSFGSWANNTTVGVLSVWFRSDAALERNWLER